MTSEAANWYSLSVLLPNQTPTDTGCSGLAVRAQAKTDFTSVSDFSSCPLLPGSLYRSQKRTRLSLPNVATTSLTYFSSRSQVLESLTTLTLGLCTQPELCTPGTGAGCLPTLGLSFQQSSKITSSGRILCLAAMSRNWSTRFLKPSGSACQARSCRNTRNVFMPRSAAQPSSRSMVFGSNVSACHISSWLIAVLGMKLQPTSHGCFLYHALACSALHRAGSWAYSAGGNSRATATRGVENRMRICGSD